MLSNNGAARPVIDDITWTEYGSGGTVDTDNPTVSVTSPTEGINPYIIFVYCFWTAADQVLTLLVLRKFGLNWIQVVR